MRTKRQRNSTKRMPTGTTTQSAALAVLIPVGILLVLFLCLGLVLGAVFLTALGMSS